MKKESQLTNQIKKLQYQLSYSEYVNKQLSQQLTILYEKTGISQKKTKYDQNINTINTQAHLQQLYYVQPLLLGYQHKIHILQQQMKCLREQGDDLKQYAKNIVKQNNFLRDELQKKNQYIIKADEIGINLNFLKLDNQNLKQINHIIKSKNTFLQERLQEVLKDKQNTVQSTSVYNYQQLTKIVNQLKQHNRELQLQFIQSKKNYQIINNKLVNEQAINNDHLRKIHQLENEILKYKNQIKIIKQQYETYQTTHESIASNLQSDLSSTKAQLEIAIRRQNEMFNKNMILQSQIQDKNNRFHNLNLQNTQLQTNNNNILQMLQTYQVKVNTLNKKIKSLQASNKEHHQGTSGYQKDLELAQWKLSQKQRQMERKQIEWKKQRDRMNKMCEERIEGIRKALQNERNQLYDQIQTLKSQKTKLQIKLKKNEHS